MTLTESKLIIANSSSGIT